MVVGLCLFSDTTMDDVEMCKFSLCREDTIRIWESLKDDKGNHVNNEGEW
jgi:hypothetical protein